MSCRYHGNCQIKNLPLDVWKNEKLHFLKTIQPIYLRKSNGLSCMKIINNVLSFNITNGKERKKAGRICFYGNEKGLSLAHFGSLN